MRKARLLSVLILLCCCVQSFAQKSAWMIYGDGSYDHATYSPVYQYESPTNLASWNINIGAGKMVSDHFMVGLQAGIGSSDIDE